MPSLFCPFFFTPSPGSSPGSGPFCLLLNLNADGFLLVRIRVFIPLPSQENPTLYRLSVYFPWWGKFWWRYLVHSSFPTFLVVSHWVVAPHSLPPLFLLEFFLFSFVHWSPLKVPFLLKLSSFYLSPPPLLHLFFLFFPVLPDHISRKFTPLFLNPPCQPTRPFLCRVLTFWILYFFLHPSFFFLAESFAFASEYRPTLLFLFLPYRPPPKSFFFLLSLSTQKRRCDLHRSHPCCFPLTPPDFVYSPTRPASLLLAKKIFSQSIQTNGLRPSSLLSP